MRYALIIALLFIGRPATAQGPDVPLPAPDNPADPSAAPADAANPETEQGAPPADSAIEPDAEAAPQEGENDTADATAEQAEEPLTPPETPAWRDVLDDMLHTGAIGLLIEGGPFMYPILLMGIIATGVVIERWRSLKMLSTDTSALRQEVADLLRTDRAEEALAKCNAEQGPVPAVLAAGVRKFFVLRQLDYDAGRVEQQVVKAMDDYSVHIVAALERHLPILATVASAAPMLGFLGTVQGMILAFRDIVEKMGETNIVEAAAAGIQTALLTTCFGLIVGIPAYVAYNYFTSVINRYVLDVEESATELIETVTLNMALEQRA